MCFSSSRYFPWFFVCSLLLRLPTPAGATTVLSLSFDSLVEEAEVIAVGTVTAIENTWDADRNVPHTFVTFSNLEVLKGEADQTELTLRFLGGPTPDGTTMQIAGVPQFTPEERAVIFCVGNNHQAVPLVGVWQGVYRVVFDAERGEDTLYDHAGQPLTALPTEDGAMLHDHEHDSHAEDAAMLHDHEHDSHAEDGVTLHDHEHGPDRAALTAAASGALTLPTLREEVARTLSAQAD